MDSLTVSRPYVVRIRKRFVEDGLDRVLEENPQPSKKGKLDGQGEAVLITGLGYAAKRVETEDG